jgi:hypothetical protein
VIRSEQRINQAIEGLDRRKALITLYTEATSPILSIDEIWTPLCNVLSIKRTPDNALNIVAQDVLLVATMYSNYNPENLIQRVIACDDYTAAAKLFDAEVTLHRENPDAMIVLSLLLDRLVSSINLWVSGNATLLKGRITDFIEDAPLLVDFFQKEYDGGKPGVVSNTFKKAYRSIILRAMLLITNETLIDNLNQSFEPEESDSDENPIKCRYLQQSTPAYLLDLSSTELRLEFSVPKVFNTVNTTTCPTAFKIFSKVAEHARENFKQYDSLFVRTNDGVVFEVVSSAFNPSTICVGLK